MTKPPPTDVRAYWLQGMDAFETGELRHTCPYLDSSEACPPFGWKGSWAGIPSDARAWLEGWDDACSTYVRKAAKAGERA